MSRVNSLNGNQIRSREKCAAQAQVSLWRIPARVQLIFLMHETMSRARFGRSPDLYVESSSRSYSVLCAFIGEIDAARPAGIIAAKNAQIASALAAAPKA